MNLNPCLQRLWVFLFFVGMGCAQKAVIFDTDMGNDIDDALALAMLHSLSDRGECRLIGVSLTNASPAAAQYIRLVNAFYGRTDVPVGSAIKSVPGGTQDGYMSATLKSAPETLLSKSHADAPSESSVVLLRRLLADATEKVTIIQVGFSTNLASLLLSKPDGISPLPGSDLVRDKVALVSAMAGNFTEGPPEYNVKLDISSARAVFQHWPTPIVLSGFEIGRDLLYSSRDIDHDFTYVPWHPIAFSYRTYHTMPYDRPTWDLTAALQAIRPDRGYFALSEKGRVRVLEDGKTTFEAGSGDRQVLRLESAKKGQILEALRLLASEPPR